MFYVSRKVGKRWGVVDTSDNVEEIYSTKALEDIYRRGIDIKGCAYVRRKFSITPVVLCTDKKVAARHKMVKGAATGVRGFDLKFEEDKVIALPLKEEFLSEVLEHSHRFGYTLEIPDIVTHISNNFLGIFKSGRLSQLDGYSLSIRLPNSVKEIGSRALNCIYLDDIEIRGSLDRVCSGSDFINESSLKCTRNRNMLSVKYLERYAISVSSNELYLLDTVFMDYNSIFFHRYLRNPQIFLGKSIEILSNCIVPYVLFLNTKEYRVSISKQLMCSATIIWLPDDCKSIRVVDMNKEEEESFVSDERKVNSYIFVIHSKLYITKLQRLFEECKIGNSTAVGIITYQNSDGYSWLRSNLTYFCEHHKKGFENYFTEETLGKCIRLRLK